MPTMGASRCAATFFGSSRRFKKPGLWTSRSCSRVSSSGCWKSPGLARPSRKSCPAIFSYLWMSNGWARSNPARLISYRFE